MNGPPGTVDIPDRDTSRLEIRTRYGARVDEKYPRSIDSVRLYAIMRRTLVRIPGLEKGAAGVSPFGRPPLSKAEMEVAQIVWPLGKATVREVFESMPKKT